MGIENQNFFRNATAPSNTTSDKPKKEHKLWLNVGRVLPDGRFAAIGGFPLDKDNLRQLRGQPEFVQLLRAGNDGLLRTIEKAESIAPGEEEIYAADGMPFAVQLRHVRNDEEQGECDAETFGEFKL